MQDNLPATPLPFLYPQLDGLLEVAPGVFRSENPARAQQMIGIAKDLISRLEVHPENFEFTDEGTELVPFRYHKVWHVSPSVLTDTRTGNQAGPAVLTESRQAAEAAARNAAGDGSGVAILRALLEDGSKELFDPKETVTLPARRVYACVYACEAEGCESGKIACGTCGGSGRRNLPTDVIWGAGGKGSRDASRCSTCEGDGYLRCKTCASTGQLTFRATVSWQVRKTGGVEIPDSLRGTRTGEILDDLDFSVLTEGDFDLKFIGVEAQQDQTLRATYQGLMTATFVSIKGAKRLSILRGIGKHNRLYQPPPFLDEAVEMLTDRLKSAGRISASDFDELYQRLKASAVIQEAVTEGAVPGFDGRNFITPDMLVPFKELWPKFLRHTKPRYTLLPWVIATPFVGAGIWNGFVGIEPDAHWNGLIGNFIILMIALWISSSLTRKRRRKQLNDNQFPIHESRIFLLFSLLSLVGAFSAMIYRWF